MSATSLYSQDIEKVIKEDPFKVSGRIGLRGGLYSADGIDRRTSPYHYGVNAKLTFSVYGFKAPLYFAYRDHGLSYGGALPRFKFSPSYKWAKIQLGDVYMNFNPYVLSGRSLRGAGMELTPGIFRVKAVYGNMRDLRSFRDTLQLGIVNENFTRKVIGGSIGLGKSRNRVDLFFINSYDDVDNLTAIYEGFTRKNNVVGGTTAAFQLFKGFSIKSNLGISLLTENLDAVGSSISEDTGTLRNIGEVNASSTLKYAGDVTIKYQRSDFGIDAQYKYIQPYYQPLTVAWVNTDIRHYTLGANLSTLGRKLFLSGRAGIQRNNVSGSKQSTSNQLILNLVSNIKFSKTLTANINYANFSQDFEARLIQIEDLFTYSVNSIVQSVSLQHRTKGKQIRYRTLVSGGVNDFSTINDFDENQNNVYKTLFGRFTTGIEYVETDLRIDLGLNYRDYNRGGDDLTNYGADLTIGKKMMDKKLSLRLRSSFNYNDRQGAREGRLLTINFNGNYLLSEKNSLGFTALMINKKSSISSDFRELRSSLNYLYNF